MSYRKPLKKALFDAIEIGSLSTVKRLLNAGADVNARDQYSNTPLHAACVLGTMAIRTVRLLLDKVADVNAKNQWGNTPFHHACARGNTAIARMLLDHGADVNARNNVGTTPLHAACWSGRADAVHVVRFLFDRGADVGARDKHNNTPLDVACKLSESAIARQPLLEVFQELTPEAYFTKFCESPGRPPGRGM